MRVTIVTVSAAVAVFPGERRPADAATRTHLTTNRRPKVTGTRPAAAGRLWINSSWSVESIDAALTVQSSCVVLAVCTDSSSFVASVGIQAGSAPLHIRIVETLEGVGETLTGLTLVRLIGSRRLPWFLIEQRTTTITRLSTGVVLTLTLKSVVVRPSGVAALSVTVTDTPSSNTDVLNTVEIPAGDAAI